VKYILSNNKIQNNLRVTQTDLKIDTNQGLDKIYSTNDFGIYEVATSALISIPKYSIGEDTTITKLGSEFEVKSNYYSAALDENTPILNRFGNRTKKFLGQRIFI